MTTCPGDVRYRICNGGILDLFVTSAHFCVRHFVVKRTMRDCYTKRRSFIGIT